jgi:hypothetical protein
MLAQCGLKPGRDHLGSTSTTVKESDTMNLHSTARATGAVRRLQFTLHNDSGPPCERPAVTF